MQAAEAALTADPISLSQDHETRLRQLEALVFVLAGAHVMAFRKAKIDKAEMCADVEQFASELGFTINNYPTPDVPG